MQFHLNLSYIDTLNENSGSVIAVFTIILALATILLGIETLRMRKNQEKPFVTAYTKPHTNPKLILLVIENFGNGIAKNVKLTTTSDFPTIEDIPLNSLKIFNMIIDSIGPHQQMSFALRYLPIKYEELRSQGKLKFIIKAEYLDISNKEYSKDISIDLEIYHGLRFPTPFQYRVYKRQV